MEYPKFKVCCRCFTFNHSKYITDAMNGFTMQQTSFPFVCTIVDDASTDGEQEVIRKYVEENFDFSEGSVAYHKETDYAHITYAQHKTNKNCYFAVLYLKENHYSQRKPKMQYLEEWRGMCEYEAFCEGDDFWIHSNKLKLQSDFLDQHKDYGMCYTNCNVLFQKSGRTLQSFLTLKGRKPIYTLEEFIIDRGYVAPPSWFYRKEIDIEFNQRQSVKSMDGTFVCFTNMLAHTKVKFLDVTTATYRVLENSACHFSDVSRTLKREKNILSVQKSLCDLYGLCDEVKNECEQTFYRRNLAFFVANNFRDDINDASKILHPKTIRDKILLFSSHFGILRKLILIIRNENNKK